MDDQKKLHNLPNLQLNLPENSEGLKISDILGVNTDELNKKILNFFQSRNPVMINEKSPFCFPDDTSERTFDSFLKLYPTFCDRDFIYVMWSYIDAIVKVSMIEQKDENA